ncbi:MAG TPA: histone deacetylase [Acidimicrobiales bacterium]|jgi:acetoin utilization deacetylase AcuC-like enzyme|nr:histone deacetylase [Acidimicrobiales bacterium]
MPVLLVTHPRFLDHATGPGHPERPARLEAVLAGVRDAGVSDALVPVEPRPATGAELSLVHPQQYTSALEHYCATGGGHLDADTVVVQASWDAAVLAAGAGPTAIEHIDRGEADAAFLAVRPPGHHARPSTAMGFCLLNNIAVAAAVLAERGERVLIVDWDAHHGNGTQDAFWDDDRVLFVSMHQYGAGFYPGSGGPGENRATTINVPLPPGTTGDAYRAALDVIVAPAAERFAPTWVLVSAGFDGHRFDPLTDLGLSAGDYTDLTRAAMGLAPMRLAFLEGGYDLEALGASAGACVAALAGAPVRPEPATGAGRGLDAVEAVRRLRVERELADN